VSIFQRQRDRTVLDWNVAEVAIGQELFHSDPPVHPPPRVNVLVISLPRSSLHVFDGCERLLTVEIADALLPCTDQQGDFVLGHHDPAIAKPRRTFGEPAAIVIKLNLRPYPLAQNVRSYQSPELI